MIQIGDKAIFAFEVGERLQDQFQIVDIWADSVLLTSFDNQVYLPQFVHSLKFELEDLLRGNVHPEYVFLNFGPTTDDFVARAVINQDFSFLKIEVLDGGQVLSVTLQTSVLSVIIENA